MTVNYQGIILHIIIVLHQRCLNCSECFQRHLMFYTCNYNIRVTHRNGAIGHILHESDPRSGSSADCSLFILSLHALALHLAVKILLPNLSVWRFEHVGLTYICRLYFQNASRTALCYATNTIMKNIPNIWHKSSTKHKEVRPDWNDKNDNAKTTRPRITWKVLPMAQVAIFKEIFDQVRKDLDCELFYSELKRHNVSDEMIYLATDNIHIVLENDNTMLIKGSKGCKC